MSVFSSKPSMQMRCYRVEYGCYVGNKKAACNCPLVKVFRKHTTSGAYERQRACANGLNIVTLHSNNFIVHNFYMCQQVFLNSLIICDLFCEIRVAFVQPGCLSIHNPILCLCKDSVSFDSTDNFYAIVTSVFFLFS